MAYAVHGKEVQLTINGGEAIFLREMPEFAKPSKEKIDITCLNDEGMKHMDGIADFSSNELAFKALYDPELFDTLDKNGDAQVGEDGEITPNEYVITLSCGSTFTLKGTHSVTYHGGGLNTAAEMSIVVTLAEAPKFGKKGAQA